MLYLKTLENSALFPHII